MLKEKHMDPDAVRNEIIELCTKSLFDYEVPEIIEFIDSMPLTGMGKIDYRKLEQN